MSNTTMKTLPATFTKYNSTFTLLRREGDVAMFARQSGTGSKDIEVVRVRKYPEYEIAGAVIEAHEAMPPDEAWGDEGWTYTKASHGETYEQAAQQAFETQVATNPYTPVAGAPTGAPRGKKREEFEIEVDRLPQGEFFMKDVAALYPEQSVPFLHLRLNELIESGKVKMVGKRKIPGARGKAPNVYSRA